MVNFSQDLPGFLQYPEENCFPWSNFHPGYIPVFPNVRARVLPRIFSLLWKKIAFLRPSSISSKVKLLAQRTCPILTYVINLPTVHVLSVEELVFNLTFSSIGSSLQPPLSSGQAVCVTLVPSSSGDSPASST